MRVNIATKMEVYGKHFLIGIALLCVWISITEADTEFRNISDCPRHGNDSNGHWYIDEKNGSRCILKCNDGYQASGCHVVRLKVNVSNHDIPVCDKELPVSGKFLLAVGTGVTVVAVAPVLLSAFGFAAGGVVAGSFAAGIQTPLTAAGSWFAVSQSAGAAGLAASTKAVIASTVGGAIYAASSYASGCEEE